MYINKYLCILYFVSFLSLKGPKTFLSYLIPDHTTFTTNTLFLRKTKNIPFLTVGICKQKKNNR